jgi:hypothetical protein
MFQHRRTIRKKPFFYFYFHLSFETLKTPINTGRFVMFSVITNIYNKKTKGPTLMEFFTDTGKLTKFFDN